MPSTRDIRRRIRSVSNTAQITKAMQMVAASKMRKAQQAALTTRPFAQLMNRIQRARDDSRRDFTHPLLEVREVRKRAVILVGTDKGLVRRAQQQPVSPGSASLIPTTTAVHHGRARGGAVHRAHPPAVGGGVHLHGLAAIHRSPADCQLCPRPVFEGRSG